MKPLILVSNDDGVRSPGLAALAAALAPLGDLLIVAPRVQQTTMGRAFPRLETGGIIEEVELLVGGVAMKAYGVEGSPAQAVAHAVMELADRRPALCVSGINYGENLGQAFTCSGTLGAAFEATSHGIPAIALSRGTPLEFQRAMEYLELSWEASQRAAAVLASAVLREGLPNDTCLLNVNVPEEAAAGAPMRRTRQSRLSYSVFRKPGRRELGSPFRLCAEINSGLDQAERDSDIHTFLFEKAISVTPVAWDTSATSRWKAHPALEEALLG